MRLRYGIIFTIFATKLVNYTIWQHQKGVEYVCEICCGFVK